MSKPWEEEWEAYPRGGGGWRVYPEGSEGPEEECATYYDDDGGRAKLAAAAPDLYRALSTLVAWHANVGGCKMTALHECMDAAIDALEKARGEE